ncbi:Peptidyl-prolyl cis-trans isomerase CWC27 like protein [Eufriesea mexicana]|uniref:Peptidyl-prolyl cis-trans isomerase n=1 Tax=Eufriesea mexicana TaxID=516756 RepID=A0A310SM76_9HYME|nr:Peptidyl-prolyl cis-trans isomerase CWC27 like protein [Eufriesea mexicana]
MKTTVGVIESALWAKETPKTCRNFIQLCMDGYWDDTTFHGIIKGFITQGGDSTGTGVGEFYCDSTILYNEKFCYRDVNLLSFGEQTEEDEEVSVILNKKFSGKGKSAHDHLTDAKLSSQPAVEPPGLANKKMKEDHSSDWKSDNEVETQEELKVVKKEKKAMKERIKNTLRDTKKEPKKVQNYKIDDVEDDKDIKENE